MLMMIQFFLTVITGEVHFFYMLTDYCNINVFLKSYSKAALQCPGILLGDINKLKGALQRFYT